MTLLIVASVAALAWWNGANDNFKGVATLYGSGFTSYRVALGWATLTQLAGSLMATLLASGLIKTFSAKGLVPDAVAMDPGFIAAVAVGGMSTVLLATLSGMPISTTHALTGALAGAGFIAVGTDINMSILGKSFFLPLLVSPAVAMVLTMAVYLLAHAGNKLLGAKRDRCVCVEATHGSTSSLSVMVAEQPQLTVITGTSQTCEERDQGSMIKVSVRSSLDALQFLPAGAICFARALNDTPKILALCLSAKALGISLGLPLLGAAMALGGLVNARKVAHTMSKKITSLNPREGLAANLTTALLVIVASRAGLPVSTTHVSASAMFGIGMINGSADRRTIFNIVLAWITTLPVAALLGAIIYWTLNR